MDRAQGADVSHYNPPRDWAALRAAVDFIGIKASEGETNTDPVLAQDLAGARGQDFELIWPYHVGRPGDARGQAKRLVDTVNPGPREFPTLDLERTSSVRFDFLDEFFDQLMTDLPDRTPFLYISNGVWVGAQYPETWDLAAKVALILPRYESVHEPIVPAPWFAIGKTWAIWQNSQSGHLPGVPGNVDLDVWNGPLAALRAFAAPVPAGP